MLYPTEVDYLVRKERYEDMIREAERIRLVQAAGIVPHSEGKIFRRLAGWLGRQLIKLGSRLKRYGTISPARPVVSR